MRALLDVNVLIALLDSDHASHHTAIRWFAKHAREGWSSCPITQNGCIRIMSNQGYPNPLPVQAVIERLAEACNEDIHEFWFDESVYWIRMSWIRRGTRPRQLTDTYLLALAVQHEGRLVTFDNAVPLAAVRRATIQNMLIL